jgi:hypothetical protein
MEQVMTIQSSMFPTSGTSTWSSPLTNAVKQAAGSGAADAPAAAANTATTAAASTTGATAPATTGHHHHHHGGSGSTAAASASPATGTGAAQGGSTVNIGVTVPSFANALLSTLGLSFGSPAAATAGGVTGPNSQSQPAAITPTTLYL